MHETQTLKRGRPNEGLPHRRFAWRAVGVAAAIAIIAVAGRPLFERDAPSSAFLDPARSGQIDVFDGYIGDDVVTAFDDLPAIRRLDPDLRDALRAATRDAADDGIALKVNSGWRSRAYQSALFDAAIEKYGSTGEARRWVNTPARSTHVTGTAVDIGPTDAAYWVNQHGADYGLCQAYANEIWHYELLTTPGGTCPVPRADSAS
jgi:zinc D-Ala-D-Ala carboxypeptidase